MSAPNFFTSPTPTIDRLRADINEGRTLDKVRFPDPAAAPLGSDDEAAGTPISEDQRRKEMATRAYVDAPLRQSPMALFLYGLLILASVLTIIGVLALLRM